MSFVENLLSEVSDQRKTIYKLLLAKPLDRLRATGVYL
jgi:hypothetical protein